jgi:hypothetical protein
MEKKEKEFKTLDLDKTSLNNQAFDGQLSPTNKRPGNYRRIGAKLLIDYDKELGRGATA